MLVCSHNLVMSLFLHLPATTQQDSYLLDLNDSSDKAKETHTM